jgi:hypothetical protein
LALCLLFYSSISGIVRWLVFFSSYTVQFSRSGPHVPVRCSTILTSHMQFVNTVFTFVTSVFSGLSARAGRLLPACQIVAAASSATLQIINEPPTFVNCSLQSVLFSFFNQCGNSVLISVVLNQCSFQSAAWQVF